MKKPNKLNIYALVTTTTAGKSSIVHVGKLPGKRSQEIEDALEEWIMKNGVQGHEYFIVCSAFMQKEGTNLSWKEYL